MAFQIANVNAPLRYGERAGQNIFSSSAIGAPQFEQQIDRQIIPAINSAVNAMQLASGGTVTGSGGAFGIAAPGQSSATLTPVGNNRNAAGYYGVEVTRDPALEAAVNSVLQRIQSTDLSAINRDVRSPLVGALTQTAGANLNRTINTQNQSLADFTRQFTEATPEIQRVTGQEVANIGELFGGEADAGSFAANLAAIRKQANDSLQNRLRTNLAGVTRSRSLADLQGGTNSYTDRIMGQETARILAEQALREAELARNDELAIRGAQSGAVGRRQQLLNDLVNRQLVPIEAAGNLSQSQLAQIAQLSGVDLSNTITERASEPLGREIDLLSRLLPAREAATFRGIGSNEGADLRGLGPIQQPDYGGLDLDPEFLLNLLSDGFQQQPGLLDTGGDSLTAPRGANTLGNLNPQDLLRIASEGFDFGAGSTASQLRVGGSTIVLPTGEEFIVNPRTGALEPVGVDRLTSTQRLFD